MPVGSSLMIDTPNPSGFALIAASNRSSAPPSVSAPSAAPHPESGAYRMAHGVAPGMAPGESPFARISARLGGSRVLPWLTAGAFVAALILGGLLRGATDTAPAAGTIVTPASPDTSGLPAAAPPNTLAVTSPGTAQPAATATATAPTGQDTLLAPSAGSPSAAFVRPPHVAPPPPPPPRAVWVPRPAPAPAAAPQTSSTGASTSASAKAECNPPFYFDGPKKVFKPSCL